jgi:D-3-phosphoglycerate dehydrogenase
LFGTPNFISTPHLGASTTEAQVNVALQVAEQLSDYLLTGGVTNALNMPSLSAEEAPKLQALYGARREAGQPDRAALARLDSPHLDPQRGRGGGAQPEADRLGRARRVPAHADRHGEHGQRALPRPERGIEVREIKTEREGDYHTLVRVSVKTGQGERSVAGTIFGNASPRLVELFGIKVEADLDGNMLYIANTDAPGFIGAVGTILGEAGINIGTFHLGRREAGGEAVLLLSVDGDVPQELIRKIEAVPSVRRVTSLKF